METAPPGATVIVAVSPIWAMRLPPKSSGHIATTEPATYNVTYTCTVQCPVLSMALRCPAVRLLVIRFRPLIVSP